MVQFNDYFSTREVVDDRSEDLELVEGLGFGSSKIDAYQKGAETYMTARQLGEALGYSEPSIAINKMVNRNSYLNGKEFCIRERLTASDGKRYMTSLWNEKGIKVILSLSNRPVHLKEQILELLENKGDIVIKPREEDENITLIKNALRIFRSDREVEIGEYRVDLLFYENNLIVECDEYGHAYYDKKEELERELELQSKGYKVYRFNPHEKGFCVGIVVGDILEILLEGEQ